MKRKTMALMLALSMCLSLLSACGSGNTATDDKPPESENVVSSTEQPEESEEPEESKEQPEESEEPKEEEPEESAEPVQEESKEENNAGTEFLALLQEEWDNGFVEGEGTRHTYFNLQEKNAFIYKDVVYIYSAGIYNDNAYDFSFCSYDIASKELRNVVSPEISGASYNSNIFNLNGNFYYVNCGFNGNSEVGAKVYDCNNKLLNSNLFHQRFENCIPFECGILLAPMEGTMVFLSDDLQKIVDITAPQREIEHGLKEDVELSDWIFPADGTVYASSKESQPQLYRLNIDTYEWEDMGKWKNLYHIPVFCGKYLSGVDGIYDRITGEQVFEYGELYPAASDDSRGNLCYFGGDKYLGFKDREYRWVNLKDLSMSDPLPFPEGKYVTILNDTYCVYEDQYGWFLWNYNTGEEETIYMFEQ